jgi:hypothetical protein
MSILAGIAPRLLDWVSATLLVPAQFGKKRATQSDNLHSGQSEALVRGDHQGSTIRPSVYTKAARHPAVTLTAAGAAAAGVGLFLWSRSGRGTETTADAETSTEREIEAHPS